MIYATGWIVIALGGAWLFGGLTLVLAMGLGLGGIETIPRGLAAGAFVAIGWIAFVVWWSPLSFTVM